ncbi:dynamin family protein [Sphaerisporangium sp. B11E5]|uniref:dynamin family protein n=1 Tax=Sphaerisporangium sp. B11E5 TaxID=3153563 RepID=UPI00325D08D8
MDDDFSREVLRLCARVTARHTDGPLRDAARLVRERLTAGRLRVAIGGRMNAGKSTLVNALIGRRVAPTGNTECTLVVARYTPSYLDRVTVTPRRDAPYEVRPGPRGGLPVEPGALGRGPEDILWVDVEFSKKDMSVECVLVDTPGLDSLNRGDEASIDALGEADAMLFVMPHPGTGDTEAFAEIRRGVGTSLAGRSGRIGVISQIDRLPTDPRDDPWPPARRLAETYAAELREQVSEVIPVAGLLAETALGADFTERDAGLLRLLAGHDPGELYDALYDADSFLDWDEGPLDGHDRARLLRMLGIHGLLLGAEAAGRGARGAEEFLALLRERSGAGRLIEAIEHTLVPRAGWLRAAAALARLTEAARADPHGGWLMDAVEELGRRPAFARAGLGEMVWQAESGRLRLDAGDVEALRLLASRAVPAEALGLPPVSGRDDVARAAAREVARWRRVEQDLARPPSLRRLARAARELCQDYHPDMRR